MSSKHVKDNLISFLYMYLKDLYFYKPITVLTQNFIYNYINSVTGHISKAS